MAGDQSPRSGCLRLVDSGLDTERMIGFMRHRLLPLLVGWVVIASVTTASAWSNHTLCSYPALGSMPEVRDASPVTAESLESFVVAEQRVLAVVLRDEEIWARAHVPRYPPLPDQLVFRTGGPTGALRGRFIAALRINPRVPLSLFIQPRPGTDLQGVTVVQPERVTFLKTLDLDQPFIELAEGESVSALDVVATATDEPDYGMDVGLWEDNGTSFGSEYGMGRQPFGNPRLEFSSQAPLHMGFFHEPRVIGWVAGSLGRTFPEYRIHLFMSLARFALETGHEYWGWRFAGWALHYVQDLTQPYHARALPGVSTARLLWVGALAAVGSHRRESELLELVTNRHLALEDYQKRRVQSALNDHHPDDPVLEALEDATRDGGYGPFAPPYVRDVLTAESAGRADATDAALQRWLPERMVNDPSYAFGHTEKNVNVLEVVHEAGPRAEAAMDEMLCGLLASFGAHSRNCLRAVLGPVSTPQSR